MSKKADKKDKPKKEKKPFNKKLFLKRLLIRVPIFLIVVYFLLVMSLKMIVRYPESLRAGLEDYVSQASNTRASINTLEHITFHPHVDIRMRDITFHSGQNAADIKMEVEYAEIASPFWSVMTPVKRLKNLKVENAEIAAGYIFSYKMFIEELGIINKEGPDQYGSFMRATGKYADKDMVLEAGLVQDKKFYYLSENVPFSISIGDVKANGQLVRKFSGQWLENVVVQRGDKVSEPRKYDLFVEGQYSKDNPVQCIIDHIDDMDKCNKYF